jgi:salicylate hydroxylase
MECGKSVSMIDRTFLIAGGGIAGLAAALGLSRAGRPVRLFEQAASFEEVGAGLQMSPNGVKALQTLGAWDAVAPACVIPTEIHVRDGKSGTILQRIRLGKPFEERFGAPYRVCHRADLLSGLLQTAQGIAPIELNTAHRVLAARVEGQNAELQFDGGTSARGAAIIAADGIRSTLRSLVCGEVAPRDRGHTIFRGLVPLGAVPPSIEADCVTLWLYPGGHVVHYPVSNWRSFNIVAACDGSAAPAGWKKPADRADVVARFPDADDDLAAMLAAIPSWIAWQGADLPELPSWTRDNLALIGDAAHATLPYLAQGAVMALEDVVVLSDSLGGKLPIAAAFETYAASRRGRTAAIQSESRKLGRIYHARGIKALARNTALRLMGAEAAINRNRWIYEWSR